MPTARRRVVAVVIAALALLALPAAAAAQTVVSIGFDDGTATQYQARSVLASHGMHATFYLNSAFVGTGDHLTWAQVHDLAADGNEIGGHTLDHAQLDTLSADQQRKEICDDRANLVSHGYKPTSFAYPYGAFDDSSKSLVQECGYTSARGVGGTVTPTDCADCPFAESIPPEDPYLTRNPGSVLSSTSLAEVEGYITQAEQHGGGWVQLVFHRICNGCDLYSITPANFSALLNWLAARTARGTVVKTVSDVIDGAAPGPSVLRNGSLEDDANADSVPDCWEPAGWGSNSFAWSRTADAHSGAWAEQLDMPQFTSGDRKLIVQRDPACTPAVATGHTYRMSTYYKSTAPIQFTVYLIDSAGNDTFWVQSPAFGATAGWAQASWTTPPVPAGYAALSFGPTLGSAGSMTVDDLAFSDTASGSPPPDTTPPTVAITSPAAGARVSGKVTIAANASDGGTGVASVRFYADGALLGTDTAGPYRVTWSTSSKQRGSHVLTAVAQDGAGNSATSAPVAVTVR